MYHTLLAIQCVSVAALLFLCAYIVKTWKTRTHGYLFFYCIATLVNNLGYIAVMTARNGDAALIGLQMSYLGRVWIPYSFLLFGLHVCQKKLPSWLATVLAVFHVATYIAVLTTRYHHLYYASFRFTQNGLYPHLVFTYGIWRNAFMLSMLVYSACFFAVVIRSLLAERNPASRHRLWFVLCSALVQVVFFVFEISGAMPGYDITMLGYTVATFFMYIALVRSNLLDITELAKDFVMDHLSEAIVTIDVNKKISFYNETAAHLFPQLQTEPHKAAAQIKLAADKGMFLHVKERVYQPTKNDLYRGGKMLGTTYVFEDATERLAYIKELEAQTQRAASANNAKSSFLARMSHEIRTPITAMLGFDELILRESADNTITTYAANIQSAGLSLLAIINDILDFSKIEAGKMEIIPVDYQVSALVTDLVNMITPRAEAKGLSFAVQVDPNVPKTLFGDEGRIKQCVLNLLTNAVKYTQSGSVSLKIDFERIDVDRMYLVVTVSDTGIGIQSDDLKRLFSPFERFEQNRNRGIEGTGLGMSIVKNLLAAMGSQLEVASEYGKGSVFSFRVEQQIVSQEKIGDFERAKRELVKNIGAYQELFHAPDAKILIVDDTPANLTVMRGLLKKTLVQVDTATDGEEGLAKARAEHYDVIFIDHLMPKMNGMEMIVALKSETDGINAATPCIALTANAFTGARDTYLAAGFSDYLSKPVKGITLEQTVRAYLPKEKIRT